MFMQCVLVALACFASSSEALVGVRVKVVSSRAKRGKTVRVPPALGSCGIDIRSNVVPAPGELNVTVASMFMGPVSLSGNATGAIDLVQRNHVDYCRQHRLNYYAPKCGFGTQQTAIYGSFDHVARSPTWSKFAIIQYLFDSGADVVLWVDADAVFTNFEKDLSPFLATNRDLVFAGNAEVNFNAGVFLLRNTPWSTQFMRDAYAICPAPRWNDNGAMLVRLSGGRPDDPTGWNKALKRSMLSCVETAEARGPCSMSLSEGVRDHVHIAAATDLNIYMEPRKLRDLERKSDRGPVPFIIHMPGHSAQEKNEQLPQFVDITDESKQPVSFLAVGKEQC